MKISTSDRLALVKEYYFSKKLREVNSLIKSGKKIINMGIGSPDIKPDNSVIKSLKDSTNFSKSNMYQGYQGISELREAISFFYKSKYDVNLNPENQILPLIGSKEGILHISMAFLNKGDKVLIPNPGYPTYTSVTKLVQAKSIFYNLSEKNKWQPDIEKLFKIDVSGVKIMWLNYPNMPTGADFNHIVLQKIINWANKKNILLVNDNPYSFILNKNPRSILSIPGAINTAMELNSLSKTFNLAGWRVGMLLGRKELINNVLKVKSNIDSGMYYGIQKGAEKALKLPNLWFDKLNKIYSSRRKAVFKLATLMNTSYDKKSVGMFVWAKINDNSISSEKFTDKILDDHEIFVCPGNVFGSQGEGFIRFSLCVELDKINIAIKRLNK